MVLNFLKKKDYWSEVGGVEGYMAAVKQLGSGYLELSVGAGYTKSDSIWGRLASFTQIKKKETLNVRKWLHTTWWDNRREIRTTFLRTQVDNIQPENLNQPSNNNEIGNQSHVKSVSLNTLVFFMFVIDTVNNIEQSYNSDQ
jgi:hypothetical protein